MIELGLSGMREYVQWMRKQYGASLSVGYEHDALQGYDNLAAPDRRTLESLSNRSELTTAEKQKVDARDKQTKALNVWHHRILTPF